MECPRSSKNPQRPPFPEGGGPLVAGVLNPSDANIRSPCHGEGTKPKITKNRLQIGYAIQTKPDNLSLQLVDSKERALLDSNQRPTD